jgi:hypothetical protein
MASSARSSAPRPSSGIAMVSDSIQGLRHLRASASLAGRFTLRPRAKQSERISPRLRSVSGRARPFSSSSSREDREEATVPAGLPPPATKRSGTAPTSSPRGGSRPSPAARAWRPRPARGRGGAPRRPTRTAAVDVELPEGDVVQAGARVRAYSGRDRPESSRSSAWSSGMSLPPLARLHSHREDPAPGLAPLAVRSRPPPAGEAPRELAAKKASKTSTLAIRFKTTAAEGVSSRVRRRS